MEKIYQASRITRNLFLILFLTITLNTSSHAQSIPSIMSSYTEYDMNSDGINEINNLSYLPISSFNINSNSKLVLVLVEDRLLESLGTGSYSEQNLLDRLKQYQYDLKAEGYNSLFIKADVYDGAQHQDGQTLLAIRKFVNDHRLKAGGFWLRLKAGHFA